MADTSKKNEEAVLIILDGQGLDDAVYEVCDVSTLEGLLSEQIDGVGELDGHETDSKQTTIYLYGPKAEELYSRLHPVLSSYPLCKNSRVIIRRGGLGSSQRELIMT